MSLSSIVVQQLLSLPASTVEACKKEKASEDFKTQRDRLVLLYLLQASLIMDYFKQQELPYQDTANKLIVENLTRLFSLMQGKCLLTKEVVYTASDIQHSKISKIGLGYWIHFPNGQYRFIFKLPLLGQSMTLLEEDGEEDPPKVEAAQFAEFVSKGVIPIDGSDAEGKSGETIGVPKEKLDIILGSCYEMMRTILGYILTGKPVNLDVVSENIRDYLGGYQKDGDTIKEEADENGGKHLDFDL
jgi:hypothetical protein